MTNLELVDWMNRTGSHDDSCPTVQGVCDCGVHSARAAVNRILNELQEKKPNLDYLRVHKYNGRIMLNGEMETLDEEGWTLVSEALTPRIASYIFTRNK